LRARLCQRGPSLFSQSEHIFHKKVHQHEHSETHRSYSQVDPLVLDFDPCTLLHDREDFQDQIEAGYRVPATSRNLKLSVLAFVH